MLRGLIAALSALMEWRTFNMNSSSYEQELRREEAIRRMQEAWYNIQSSSRNQKSEIQLEAEKGLIIEGKVNETDN